MMAARRRPRRDLLELLLDYVEELQRASEELVESLFETGRPSWDVREGCIEPLTHISVSPDEVVITMDMPFVRPETIRVRPVEDDLIEVVAEMKKAIRPRDLGVVHVEGELRKMRCRTRLPVPVEVRAMRFEFRKGILEVRFPRKKQL